MFCCCFGIGSEDDLVLVKFCFVFLRRGSSVALELALVDQVGLELRDPPASALKVILSKISVTWT